MPINNKFYIEIQSEFPKLESVSRIAMGRNKGLDALRVEQLFYEQDKFTAVAFTACSNGMFHVQEWENNEEKYSSRLHSLEIAKNRLNSFFKK